MTSGKPGPDKGCVLGGLLVLVGGLILALAMAASAGWLYYSWQNQSLPGRGTTSDAPPVDLDSAVATLRDAAVPANQTRALELLEKEAEGGDARAMVMAAACYRGGLGVGLEDQFKAFEWYRRAAEAGEPVGMVEMAGYYAEGVWVEADEDQSRQWLQRAAAAGSVEARWQLETGGR